MACAVLEMLEQLLGAGELDRTRERHVVVRGLRWALLDHAKQEAGTHAVVAPEARVVRRQQHDARLRVQHAGSVEQRCDHQRPTGMRRADLVLNHVPGKGRPQLGRQRQCGILVNRAEHVLSSILAQEAQHLRLAPAAATGRRQPAREAGQVQHLDLDGCPPQVAVVGTQEQAMQPSCAVARSRHHGLPGRRRRRGRCLPGEAHRRERRREPETEPAP